MSSIVLCPALRLRKGINKAGSAIQLTRDDRSPDIPILFLDIPARSKIKGSGIQPLEGKPISGAGVRVFAKDGQIR